MDNNKNQTSNAVKIKERDELLVDAIRLVLQVNNPSATFLQRHFFTGYNRACRIMEQMEALGVVGPELRLGKPRKILVNADNVEQLLASQNLNISINENKKNNGQR